MGREKRMRIWSKTKKKMRNIIKIRRRMILGYIVVKVIMIYNVVIAIVMIPIAFLFEVCKNKPEKNKRVCDSLKCNVATNSIRNLIIWVICGDMCEKEYAVFMIVRVIIGVHAIDVGMRWIEKIREDEIDSSECAERTLMVTVRIGVFLNCGKYQKDRVVDRKEIERIIIGRIMIVLCKEIRGVTRW